MKTLPIVKRAWLVCMAFAMLASLARAENVYVTDMLQLDLYATEAMSGSAIRKLKSGDRLEVLERSGRAIRVTTDAGQTGWVKSLYIVGKEPARARLNQIEAANTELEGTVEQLRAQLAEQQGEVQRLKATRGDADQEQEEAMAELERLRIENADMRGSLSTYAGSVPLSWLLAGLAVALVGGFVGGWYWFDARSRARHGGYRIH